MRPGSARRSSIEPRRSRASLALVGTPARAGLVDDHFREQRQSRLGLAPDPASQVFAGRILETRDLVQQLVIDAIEDWLKRGAHVREIHDPAGMRIDRSFDVQLDSKGVAVQARTLVPGRHVGQSVRCLYGERTEDLHITPLCGGASSRRSCTFRTCNGWRCNLRRP